MQSKTDIAVGLIYTATQLKHVGRKEFRSYLDFYADLRALNRTDAAVQELLAEECPADDEYTIVDVTPKPAKPEIPANKDETKKQEHVFTGRGCAEKREIHDRLLAYREANGIGCLAPLAAAAKGVSQEELRMMLGSAPVPLPKRATPTLIPTT